MRPLTLEQQQRAVMLLSEFVDQYPSVEDLVGVWAATIDLLISIEQAPPLTQKPEQKVIYAEQKFKAR